MEVGLTLAIDTSATEQGAVLFNAGEVQARAEWTSFPRQQAGPALRELLAGNPIPARVVVGSGPGGFSSLRGGMALGLGLAWAWSVEFRVFSSLRLLALRVPAAPARVAAALDAGSGRCYLGIFGGPGLVQVEIEEVQDWGGVQARCAGLPLAVAATGLRSQIPLAGAQLEGVGVGLERLLRAGTGLERVGYDEVRARYLQDPGLSGAAASRAQRGRAE